MKMTFTAIVVSSALSICAFADDTKTTIKTGTGTTEVTTDTSHNPITNNDTATKTVETKNEKGQTTSKRKVKTKRDRKTGKELKKETETEKMNAEGDTTDKKSVEETHK